MMKIMIHNVTKDVLHTVGREVPPKIFFKKISCHKHGTNSKSVSFNNGFDVNGHFLQKLHSLP